MELAVPVQRGLQIRSVGDRRYPSRLDEANQVRRDGHEHVVATMQQLTADGGAGLDIATSYVTCTTIFTAKPSLIYPPCAFCQ